jgi:hypothetical protein
VTGERLAPGGVVRGAHRCAREIGELGARATFQGREDVFERILEKLGPTDEVKRTANGIEELNARLASLNIYPRR